MSERPTRRAAKAAVPTHSGRRGFLIGGALVGAGAIAYGLYGRHTPGAQDAVPGPAATGGGTPRQGGTLVIGEYQEPTVYDPNHQYSWETYRVDRHIYESLIAEDLTKPAHEGPPELIPALAESWQISDDATTFTFKLRRDVKFHDGSDFDAHAVEFNVRRFHDPQFEYYDVKAAAFMKAVYGDLKGFELIDDHTVRYTFNKPFRDFPRMLPQAITYQAFSVRWL
ncbi:ABC transporter substrate-binding protein [Paraburkholderia sp. SG-MS1]|uniref:ABC transporter substrate-binding protein n=1 Tax=Paraburkholderia sp. SG-MS1 TaxID=2023741 RepID=UPI001448066B|nr:ABC transporter substrate-binding protein [Paraburkholderia sp. SG-MS1]